MSPADAFSGDGLIKFVPKRAVAAVWVVLQLGVPTLVAAFLLNFLVHNLSAKQDEIIANQQVIIGKENTVTDLERQGIANDEIIIQLLKEQVRVNSAGCVNAAHGDAQRNLCLGVK